MIEKIFTRTSVLEKLEAGPLGCYLSDLAAALQEQSYSTNTIQKYLQAADAFGHWLNTHQVLLSTINEEVIAQFVASLERRRFPSCPQGIAPHEGVGLNHLLQVLRKQGVVAQHQTTVPTTHLEQFLADYDQYLKRTCGATLATRHQYLYFARHFLLYAFDSPTPVWSALRAETITQFVQRETARRSGAGRKKPGSAIRIFLRYLVAHGVLPAGLDAAVPGMRVWKHASLPKHLTAEEVIQVLAASADGTPMGRRNRAIVMLLARLGIRAMEAAQLQLGDIDWHTGFVVIRASKNHRERSLPLPQDLGEALIEYLQNGRPPTSCREIFLKQTAPFRPLLTSSAISKVVKHLLKKVGIERSSLGAHLFRHTAASKMVNCGVSFKDVADVLGHQSLQTTGIYAKLDLKSLSQVAVAWPGGTQ